MDEVLRKGIFGKSIVDESLRRRSVFIVGIWKLVILC